jgi:peptidyl-prolyl cis-trans isomerase C
LRLSAFSLSMAFMIALSSKAVADTPPAAIVNGQPISEAAVARPLKRIGEKDDRAKARAEILDFLIENALIDQYLVQQKTVVDQKEVDARLTEIKKEIEKSGQTYVKVLQSLEMTEAEFAAQILADLRWEKFASAQSTDKNLKALFDQSADMFDGSMVRARHILLTPNLKDAKAMESARAELIQYRKLVEAKAADAVGKLPATADNLTREQERQKQIIQAFSDLARDKSACPSKRDGGELNWFPRAGSMVEAFAKAAFALKPFEMSDPVQTQFGYHLILCTDRKPGQSAKFEDVKEEVREVYCNRLREYLVSELKKTARIEIANSK